MPKSSLEMIQNLFNYICPFLNNLCAYLDKKKCNVIHYRRLKEAMK